MSLAVWKAVTPVVRIHVLMAPTAHDPPSSATMSAADLDLDPLSPSERTALETYTTVTGQEPAEAIALLRRSQWNVQVGALPSSAQLACSPPA